MASRHFRFYRDCPICKRKIYGTSISQRNHKENCREARKTLPGWAKKLGERTPASA